MAEQVMVARTLTKRYKKNRVVDGVNLSVGRGRIYGLVGRNGAGKTTLIRMAAGQTPITSGAVELFGADTPQELEKARNRTGVMVEIPSFYPYLSAADNLEYYRLQRGIPGKEAVGEALKQVGLTDTGKKKFKHFSLGMKQRLGLALALMNHPDLLLLDEPINGLDPEGIVEFRNLLLKLCREQGISILISSHILTELANLATDYGFIDRGRLLEQITAAELAERCRACLEIRVDDAAKAARLLEREMNTRDYEVLPENLLRLYSHMDEPQLVAKLMVENGVALRGVEERSANLEDYFLRLIGGVHGA